MTQTLALFLAGALLAAARAFAQPAVVEAVQYPAWLERGGHAVPLTPGTALQARDRLRTGANARARLRLAEGSAVKLGENARFTIERAEERGLFRAAFAVIAGALRFTTDPGSPRRDRDVAIKVKSVSVGIRGTDLWGKATPERDWVALLEGRATVASPGHPARTLERSLDVYQVSGDGAPEVVAVDAGQMQAWARETEMQADGAVAHAQGPWRMVAAVKPDRDAALALARRLRAAGYPAQIVAKEGYFIVQVAGLAGETEARALMAAVRGVEGVALPTVHEGP